MEADCIGTLSSLLPFPLPPLTCSVLSSGWVALAGSLGPASASASSPPPKAPHTDCTKPFHPLPSPNLPAACCLQAGLPWRGPSVQPLHQPPPPPPKAPHTDCTKPFHPLPSPNLPAACCLQAGSPWRGPLDPASASAPPPSPDRNRSRPAREPCGPSPYQPERGGRRGSNKEVRGGSGGER
jgi:hypothetical protein